LVGLLEEAIRQFPDQPEGLLVQMRLETRTRKYRKAMEEGLVALKEHFWEKALEHLLKAIERGR